MCWDSTQLASIETVHNCKFLLVQQSILIIIHNSVQISHTDMIAIEWLCQSRISGNTDVNINLQHESVEHHFWFEELTRASILSPTHVYYAQPMTHSNFNACQVLAMLDEPLAEWLARCVKIVHSDTNWWGWNSSVTHWSLPRHVYCITSTNNF